LEAREKAIRSAQTQGGEAALSRVATAIVIKVLFQ
jgi:hypothetical protein